MFRRLLAKGIFYNLPFFALLTLGAANIVLGQEAITNAIITGRVFDSTGSVVSRATVQLYSDPEGKTALAEQQPTR